MKAPCNDNYPLGINSSCTYDWVPCDHGSHHDVLLRFHFANNLEHLSSTSQRSSSDPTLFHLREFNPPGISTILTHCTTSDEFLLVRYFSSIFPIHWFWVVVNLEPLIPFARHPFSRCRRYLMASSKTSRHNVSWSSSNIWTFPSVN